MNNKDNALQFAKWFFFIGLVFMVAFSFTDLFWDLSVVWLPIIIVVVSGGLSLRSYIINLNDSNEKSAKWMIYFNIILLLIDIIARFVVLPYAISNVFF
jgi:TRAP-type mannitol/chloroaromatic compound transport system permease small subunit